VSSPTIVHFPLKEYPPFPSDVPTAQLSKNSLRKLLSANGAESEVLYDSCKTSGFFLLELSATPHGEEILQDVAKAFEMTEALFKLDLEEKMKYSMKPGRSYG
jgi:isopenicillin N synthase-like dioxygenase